MLLTELWQEYLVENDYDHAKALRQTGYWGAQGAGSLFLARATKRLLIAHRSDAAHAKMLTRRGGRYEGYDWRDLVPEQPGTWGTWGGAIDAGEDPETGARREADEELGHSGQITMLPLYVFQDKKFRYSNFLALVETEFTPVLDWENQGFKWCEYGQWPHPPHFGLTALLNDAASVETIQKNLSDETTSPPQ